MATAAARYRDAKDLREFIERAKTVGGSANLYFAHRAVMRCLPVAFQGRVGAEQSFNAELVRNATDIVRIEAHRQWLEPCAGFETRPFNFPSDSQDLYQRMQASTDGPMAEFWRSGRTRDETNAFARRALESSDVELAAAVSPGIAYLRLELLPATATEEERNAQSILIQSELQSWELAMCELGADCGRSTLVWFNACMKTGNCGEGNYRNGIPGWTLGARHMPAIRARRDEIVAAIQARDWAALGLAP